VIRKENKEFFFIDIISECLPVNPWFCIISVL